MAVTRSTTCGSWPGLGAWLGWTIPLAAVQWWLTQEHVMAPSSISQSQHTSAGVISGRSSSTRRAYRPERGGNGDGIQRQDRARRPRLGAGLGAVRRADGARGCAQRSLSRLGRHRHRDVGLLRRPGRDADDEPHRRTRCAAVAVPHHRAVLADARIAADRTQRHHRRHGHHRGVHRRLPGLQRPHPATTPRCCPRCSPSRATTPTASASGT